MIHFSNLMRNLSNLPGWRTNRNIIVIESDDWGSIRMPSNQVFEKLKASGLDLTSGDALRYNMYDSLETADDLSALFETLSSVKDKNDNPAVFTPLSLVANPDFTKIRESDYNEYFYELFTETLKRLPGCENSFSLWKEGREKGLFIPQFHGREHLNVKVWMKALLNNDPHTRLAFDYGIWGYKNFHPSGISYQAAFDLDVPEEIEYQKDIIASGLGLFENIHGYKATLFVPPNGPFNETLEETAFYGGVKYMSVSKIHREPQGNGIFKKKFHYLGQKNKFGLRYLTRNCFFEPSQQGKDWVNSCLNDISIAFKWHKPAIISSHRVNYIGALNPENRSLGLKQLNTLLFEIIKNWPDIEFMTSAQLGNLIFESK